MIPWEALLVTVLIGGLLMVVCWRISREVGYCEGYQDGYHLACSQEGRAACCHPKWTYHPGPPEMVSCGACGAIEHL